MTAIPIGSGAAQHDATPAGDVGHPTAANGRSASATTPSPSADGLFANDALIAIEQSARLVEQADALAELFKSALDANEGTDRALSEEEAHEWLDPEALAEFLAETLQQDEDAQRSREALVADLEHGAPHTMQHLLRERCDNNPTKLFVALQQAAGALRRGAVGRDDDQDDDDASRNRKQMDSGAQDNAAQLARLRDMTQELELTHGARIRADLNTSSVWRSHHAAHPLDADEIVSMQASYATLVEGDARIAPMLHRILDGVSGLGANKPSTPTGVRSAHTVLEQFIQALGRDIDALRPSVDRAHLHALLGEKSNIVAALTVLEQCDTLAATLYPATPEKAATAALRTMRKAVDLTDQSYFSPEAFSAFARTMASDAHQHTGAAALPVASAPDPVLAQAIPFLHGFSVVLRDMPERVFTDAQQQIRAREAVQHALDDLIDEENADA